MTVLPGGGASGGGGGQASAIYAKIGGGSYSVPTPIDGKSLREPLVHPDIYTNHQRTKTKLVQQNICIQNHVSLNFPLQEITTNWIDELLGEGALIQMLICSI